MSRRAPWTVWMYVTAEMWRLILLTTGVLLTVTAFGVTVKYLADGKLGAADCLKLMFLAMPPMLHYVLPFAASFGATLAYHRLAADNEAVACHAGGVSHRALLGPAVASGVVLSVLLVYMSTSVIPRFLEKMALMVSQDATRLIVASIQRREAVKLNDSWVYADAVSELGPDERVDAYQRLWLGGVLVVSMDKEGNVREQGTAREAFVWLQRTTGRDEGAGGQGGVGAGIEGEQTGMTRVTIHPIEPRFVWADGTRGQTSGEMIAPFYIPNAFRDDPKFMTGEQLRGLREHPERISGVDKKRRALATVLAQREMFEAVRARLQAEGEIELKDAAQRFTLRAADVRRVREDADSDRRGWYWVAPQRRADGVQLDMHLGGGRVQRQSASTAWMRLSPSDTPGQAIAITLQFNDVAAENLDAPETTTPPREEPPQPEPGTGRMVEWRVSQLALAEGAGGVGGVGGVEVMNESAANLRRAAEARIAARPGDAHNVRPVLEDMNVRIAELMREVLSKRHERLAMAAACLVMVVLGSVMALRLRDSLPLTIYLWAFFPALGAVLTVSAGQQLTHEHGAVGLVVLWGGVVGLGGYTLVELRRLARH